MQLSEHDLNLLADIAINAAKQAAKLIQDFANRVSKGTEIGVMHKTAGSTLASQVLTQMDIASDALIRSCLEESCRQFDLAFLTEESVDNGLRFEKDYFWCVDPLDGTLAFIEGRAGYSVSIALVSMAGVPVIGVVCDAVNSRLYCAIKGQGARINDRPWSLTKTLRQEENSQPRLEHRQLALACDGSLLGSIEYPEIIKAVEKIALRHGYVNLNHLDSGGAVMNACRVLEHAPGVYFKLPKAELGGGSVWDFAATAVLYHEMSAIAYDVFGRSFNLNPQTSTFMNHCGVIFSTEAGIATDLQQLIAEHTDFD